MKSICLIFPKPFEASAFILGLGETLKNFVRISDWHWKIAIEIKNIIGEINHHKIFQFEIKIINESDFMFYQKIEKLSSSNQYILIGSCGLMELETEIEKTTTIPVKHDKINSNISILEEKIEDNGLLYRVYVIKEARKYDRGSLSSYYMDTYDPHLFYGNVNPLEFSKVSFKSERFISEPKKHQMLEVNDNDIMRILLKEEGVVSAPILSSNFLMNSTFKPTIDFKHDGIILFDMETYDFIRMCKNKDLEILAVLRIVSDIIGDKQEKTRCLFRAQHMVKLVVKILKCTGLSGNDIINGDAEEIRNLSFINIIDKIKKVFDDEIHTEESHNLIMQYFSNLLNLEVNDLKIKCIMEKYKL